MNEIASLRRTAQLSTAVLFGFAVLLFAPALLLAPAAGAEVRRIEAVGAVPVYPDRHARQGAVAPRDAAIRKALREAVERVAEEFIADRPLSGGPDSGGPPVIDGEGGEGIDLKKVLGAKMVPYTSRFRVVEDRGERPALFADDPGVTSEYVVIVEVHVDVERVRKRLVSKGVIPEGTAAATPGRTLYLEIEGLTAYPAYARLRELLLDDRVGAASAIAVDLRRGHALLQLEAQTGAVELLERLLTVAPPEMKLVPLHAAPDRAHIEVEWNGSLVMPGTGLEGEELERDSS